MNPEDAGSLLAKLGDPNYDENITKYWAQRAYIYVMSKYKKWIQEKYLSSLFTNTERFHMFFLH